MSNVGKAFLALTLGLMIGSVAFAHHGTASYDTTKSVSAKGAVTAFDFVNPHVEVYLDAKDARGNVEKWQGELTSPNHLARAGWHKDTIKPGETITISGFPSKSGARVIWIQKVLLADGTQLDTSGGS